MALFDGTGNPSSCASSVTSFKSLAAAISSYPDAPIIPTPSSLMARFPVQAIKSASLVVLEGDSPRIHLSWSVCQTSWTFTPTRYKELVSEEKSRKCADRNASSEDTSGEPCANSAFGTPRVCIGNVTICTHVGHSDRSSRSQSRCNRHHGQRDQHHVRPKCACV